MITKNKYINLIISIVCGSLFLAVFILHTVLNFTGFYDVRELIILPYVFLVLMLFFIAFAFVNFVQYLNVVSVEKSLDIQNSHSFGKSGNFFNRTLFEMIITNMRKKRRFRKSQQSLIVFSGIPHSVSMNGTRKNAVVEFHSAVVEFLNSYFVQNKIEKTHISCFDNGVFMIYCFGDNRMETIHLVNVINDKLFQLVQEKNIHLLITPYFGIDEIKNGEILNEAIENALLARRVSEKNFEIFNFYKDGFREVATSDDAKMIIDGLTNHEFVVYYQPKFDIARHCFISSEALIRWNSPSRGIVMPGQFVPIANAAGLNHELDLYVFERVCEDLNENKKKGRRVLPVSLNFSLYEFYSESFLNLLVETMKKYNVDPRLIQIEILESTSQANPFLSIAIIKKLKALGMRVLMDDFGTGYSNLNNLLKIPFDAIKIDKSYVDNIVFDEKAREICQCMVSLGRINGLEVIAEGVSTQEQVDLLYKMGCDTIQGYFYSEPLSKTDFDKFLVDNKFEKEERVR